jgi:opacity protein-like surface antigen
MKKVAILFTILILVGSMSFGQDIAPGPSAGSKGILFSFSGLSNLGAGSYQGGFGAKLYLSDYTAVRAAVQLALLSTKTPANNVGDADASSSNNTFGIGGAFELHLTKSRISPYIGAGILFSTTSTETKPEGPAASQQTIKNANGSGPTSFGIGVLVGVEYYVVSGVSLSAEYQLGFISSTLKDAEVSTPGLPTVTTKQGSTSAIGINNTGSLTLAVYF